MLTILQMTILKEFTAPLKIRLIFKRIIGEKCYELIFLNINYNNLIDSSL